MAKAKTKVFQVELRPAASAEQTFQDKEPFTGEDRTREHMRLVHIEATDEGQATAIAEELEREAAKEAVPESGHVLVNRDKMYVVASVTELSKLSEPE